MVPGTRMHIHTSLLLSCAGDYRYPIHGSHKMSKAVVTELYEENPLEEMISMSANIPSMH
jgi:hypothetical protein